MVNVIVELKILVTLGKVNKDHVRKIHSVYQAHFLKHPTKDSSQINIEDIEIKPVVIFKGKKSLNELSEDEFQKIRENVIKESINHFKNNYRVKDLRPSVLN